MEHSGSSGVTLTAASLNSAKKLFVTAFSNGVFLITELPDFTLLQSFR